MEILKIISDAGLRFGFVAEQLFPENLHPYNALNRIVVKDAELKAGQLTRLSELTGKSVDCILGLTWSGTSSGGAKTDLLIARGQYTVAIRKDSLQLIVYRSGAPVAERRMPVGTTVRQLLEVVDAEIAKIEQQQTP